MQEKGNIDIPENYLRRRGELLDILLFGYNTGNNIIWATDSYVSYGKDFAPKKLMKAELVTGVYGKLIQPRAVKSKDEQKKRTKDKAEVFTPLKIIGQINKQIDWQGKSYPPDKTTWQAYVKELKLEITCGEAPFIVSRYNPTASTGKIIKISKRVGFLDRKLHFVSKYCDNQKDWLFWAKEAYKSSYGYEWQGDNLLIARENLLYTLIDYFKEKFGKNPSLKIQTEFAEIISWNIFQMDGIRYVIPMSCKHETEIIPGELTLFGETPDTVNKKECKGCKLNDPFSHNGKYVYIMDWQANKKIRFVDLLV